MEQVLQIRERIVPHGWVIGGTTRLLDVWTPSPLLLRAPAFRYPRHTLRFTLADGESDAEAAKIKLGLKRRITRVRRGDRHRFADSDIIFDCRHDSTGNVAHILQNQIGVALYGLDAIGIADRWRDLVFVVHKETPKYATDLFEALGFRVWRGSGSVIATMLAMDPRKFPVRATASHLLRRHAVSSIGLLSNKHSCDDRVFLARRNRRSLENMEEILVLLKKEGYRTVYAEDLAPEEQIRTVAQTPLLFGLHGAGMGHTMFRDPGTRGMVMEAFSSTFSTNWARAICSITNDAWLGVLGDFDFNTMRTMHNGAHSHAHEADDYRLDPRMISTLLHISTELLRQPGGDESVLDDIINNMMTIDLSISTT